MGVVRDVEMAVEATWTTHPTAGCSLFVPRHTQRKKCVSILRNLVPSKTSGVSRIRYASFYFNDGEVLLGASFSNSHNLTSLYKGMPHVTMFEGYEKMRGLEEGIPQTMCWRFVQTECQHSKRTTKWSMQNTGCNSHKSGSTAIWTYISLFCVF